MNLRSASTLVIQHFRPGKISFALPAVIVTLGAIAASVPAAVAFPTATNCTQIDQNNYFITLSDVTSSLGFNCTVNDKVFTLNSANTNPNSTTSGINFNIGDYGLTGGEEFQFSYVPITDEYKVVFNTIPASGNGGGPINVTGGPNPPNPAIYTYIAAINQAGNTFNTFSTSQVATGTVVGSTVPGTVSGATSITVQNSFSGGVTSITNTITQNVVEVPGPLPIMGAATAFGFSRKLRRRIKQTT